MKLTMTKDEFNGLYKRAKELEVESEFMTLGFKRTKEGFVILETNPYATAESLSVGDIEIPTPFRGVVKKAVKTAISEIKNIVV